MIKKQSAISVLIPVYNVEKCLRQCLESIITQTLSDLEIIIINDGSTDSSPEIIWEYAERDSRVKVIDKPNSGYGASMNMGLEKAMGKYIGIVESDDWIEPDMFECLYEMAERDNLDVARSEFFEYISSKELSTPRRTDFVKHDVVFAPRDDESVFFQQPSIWANIYRRDFLESNGIRFLETPGASYQDTAFSFKVYACAERFEMTYRPFYHYRIDGGSSSFQNTTKVFCVSDEYTEIWRYVRERGLYDRYRHLIPNLQLNGYKWNYNRLIAPYDAQFLERWIEQFKEIDAAGDIVPGRFIRSDREIIDDVVHGRAPVKEGDPLVSVVVPVYNMEEYLRKCLDSIVSQTLRRIEIICVDDGSTDGSASILGEYAAKDSRIKVITKENGGLSSARNAGITASRARYIGFVDSDDWIEPDTYAVAYDRILGCDMVCYGTAIEGDAMVERRQVDVEYYAIRYSGLVELDDEVRLSTNVAAWNKLYRRDLIVDNGLEFPVGLLYEDYSFYWRYAKIAKTAYFVPENKYHYLRREGSIMQKTFGKTPKAVDHLRILDEVYESIDSTSGWEGSQPLMVSMFLNCFWFAYENSPNSLKKDVLDIGSNFVRKYNITGDNVIGYLSSGEYEKIDPEMKYEERYADIGDWVKGYNKNNLIRSWKIVYDSNSDNPELNWNHKGGIVGGSDVDAPHVRKNFVVGGEYRIILSLWGAEVCSIDGVLLNDLRVIWGSSVFDGVNLFALSLDIKASDNKVRVYGYDVRNGQDYSENCRLLMVEKRIF